MSQRTALNAEWTKLTTAPGPRWLLLAVVIATAALGVLADAATRCPSGSCQVDPAKVSLTGIYLSQALVVVVVFAISRESVDDRSVPAETLHAIAQDVSAETPQEADLTIAAIAAGRSSAVGVNHRRSVAAVIEPTLVRRGSHVVSCIQGASEPSRD